MPKPRKRQVSLQDTPYYHCISRCVRRAFLCGIDPVTGFDFTHRRDWIVKRLKALASVFAIEICAYAVMNNHYHVVLRVCKEQSDEWSDREVAERWLQLFSGPLLARSWVSGSPLDAVEMDVVMTWVATWRQRLADLSWFMRCLNEAIARMANREDRCTGRFWEGRFKSQALLDEQALLACMAYVDLNPIRAAIASTPEHSHYTSVRDRIRNPDTHQLRPFIATDEAEQGLPYSFLDYLELVEWTGRIIRSDKRGSIPHDSPPILRRLNLPAAELIEYLSKPPTPFSSVLGPLHRVRAMARNLGMKFLRGAKHHRLLFQGSG